MSRVNNLFIRGILDQSSHDTKYRDLKSLLQRQLTQRDKLAADRLDEAEIAELLSSFRAFAATIRGRLDTADFSTRRSIVEQMVKCVIIGKSVITIEHIAPCKKSVLRNNLELRTLNKENEEGTG